MSCSTAGQKYCGRGIGDLGSVLTGLFLFALVPPFASFANPMFCSTPPGFICASATCLPPWIAAASFNRIEIRIEERGSNGGGNCFSGSIQRSRDVHRPTMATCNNKSSLSGACTSSGGLSCCTYTFILQQGISGDDTGCSETGSVGGPFAAGRSTPRDVNNALTALALAFALSALAFPFAASAASLVSITITSVSALASLAI